MVNVQEFLKGSNIDVGVYTLVAYNNKIEPTYFSKYCIGDGDWFLESPCELFVLADVGSDAKTYCKEYAKDLESDDTLEEGETGEDYVNNYIRPMIVDNILYEIENFQCSPYLPHEVDNIKIISERECLEYMLKEEGK